MIQRIKKILLKNNSEKQTIAKNTFWLMGSEMLIRLFRFFLIIYVARVLGAEGWGLFSYAISFVGTFLVFSDSGISTLFTKEYANGHTRYIKAMIVMKFFLMTISILIAIIAGFNFASLPINSIVFPIVSILTLDSIRDFISTILRSQEKMELEALVKIFTNIVLVIASLILLSINLSPISLAFGYMIGGMAGCILAIIISYDLIIDLIKKYKENTFKKEGVYTVWKLSFPIAITGFASTLIMNIDTIMLGIWKTPTEIGWYSSAQRIFQFTLIIPGIFVTALFPTLSKIYSQNKDRFIEVAKKSFSILFIFGVLISFGGFIVANDLMMFIFGNEYAPAGQAFAWLTLGTFFAFPGNIFYTFSIILEKQGVIAINIASAILINFILNIILIPKLGITGAAMSATVTQAYLLILNGIFFKNISYISKTDFRDIFIALILTGIFLLTIQNINVFVRISISTCIYFVTLVILKNPALQMIINMIKKVN